MAQYFSYNLKSRIEKLSGKGTRRSFDAMAEGAAITIRCI